MYSTRSPLQVQRALQKRPIFVGSLASLLHSSGPRCIDSNSVDNHFALHNPAIFSHLTGGDELANDLADLADDLAEVDVTCAASVPNFEALMVINTVVVLGKSLGNQQYQGWFLIFQAMTKRHLAQKFLSHLAILPSHLTLTWAA